MPLASGLTLPGTSIPFVNVMVSLPLCLIADADLSPPDNDFSPAVFFIVLCVFAVCLVIIGIGIVIGLVCAAVTAVLAALGIVSFSAMVALWQRRFSAGLRALHYQLCALAALAALPAGVGLLWLGSDLLGFHLRHRHILLAGVAGGAAAGLLVAAALDWFGRFAWQRLVLTLRPSPPTLPSA